MKKLLIQANNLQTVIDVFTFIYQTPGCSMSQVSQHIGFTLRQANYYTNACLYLGLIDESMKPTPLAHDIFENSSSCIKERIYECIISNELIGKIFAQMKLQPQCDIYKYAEAIVKDNYPGYSETVYKRRINNIITWCDIIIKNQIYINPIKYKVMRLSKTNSLNRYSLIEYDDEKKNEPKEHIGYKEKKIKIKEYNAQIESRDGWSEFKVTKTHIYLRKNDPELVAYEKQLWRLFFNMGFPYLNKSGRNTFYYGQDENMNLNFSIFGQDKDEYSFIFLDCFAQDNKDQLDAKLQTMKEEFGKIADYLVVKLGDNELVFKYIVAIKGFELSPEQEKIVNDNNFTVITEVDVNYFEELYTNLKSAAYYQFCGKLFEGMTIPKIETKIPAIRGRMGGHIYYAFSIDPQILLRLSFVLHKTKAHEEAMPTYQRLVKKSRLISITDFLNNHGFFPNSIVVNLDEECEFVEVQTGHENCNIDTEIGYLKIPQKYRVAYIIDGQHRLMGYAGCKWNNQQIPVVAFEKLAKPTQVKLFMDMNQNQKAVPKELRLTLYKDLLPTDPRLSQRMYGLRLQIAFAFADNRHSPLRGFVGDGVDRKVYTLDYLQQALKYSTIYFGNVRNEFLETPGIFFRGNADDQECFEQSKVAIRDFLFMCVQALLSGLNQIESLEDGERKNVFIRNIGMNGYLRFVADLVAYKQNDILPTIADDAMAADPETVFGIIRPYLESAYDFARNCEPEEASRLRTWTGAKAPVQYQRTFQRVIHELYDDFNPSGLEDWIANNSSEVVSEALDIINQLRVLIKKEFTNRFSDKDNVVDWVADSLPDSVSTECFERQRTFNTNATPEQIQEKTLWDFVMDDNYFKIACHSNNDPLIKEDFTYPGMRKTAKREKRYEWIKDILRIEKGCVENHSCESNDIEELRTLYQHFLDRGLIQETDLDSEVDNN